MRPWLSTYIVYGVDTDNCEKGFPATWHSTGDVKEHIVLNKPCLTRCLKAYSTHTPNTEWRKYGSAWDCGAPQGKGLDEVSEEIWKWSPISFRGMLHSGCHRCQLDHLNLMMLLSPCRIRKEPHSALWPHYCPGLSLPFLFYSFAQWRKKPAYHSGAKGFEMLHCKVLGKCARSQE